MCVYSSPIMPLFSTPPVAFYATKYSVKRRYACPNKCSGNGACRSMREMGFMRTATPLVDATGDVSALGESATGFEVMYGRDSREGSSTWDSQSVFGCVCDSSWEVRART